MARKTDFCSWRDWKSSFRKASKRDKEEMARGLRSVIEKYERIAKDYEAERESLHAELTGGDTDEYRVILEMARATNMSVIDVMDKLTPEAVYEFMKAEIRRREDSKHEILDPIRNQLNGPIVIALYDALNNRFGSPVLFDDLCSCWNEDPTDLAIQGRLKELRNQLIKTKLTIEISMSKREATMS